MIKAILPLCLMFAAGSSLACPGAGKAMDAKADASPSVTAALPAKPQQSKSPVATAGGDAKTSVSLAAVKKPAS